MLKAAVAFWQANRVLRKPVCIACKTSLGYDVVSRRVFIRNFAWFAGHRLRQRALLLEWSAGR